MQFMTGCGKDWKHARNLCWNHYRFSIFFLLFRISLLTMRMQQLDLSLATSSASLVFYLWMTISSLMLSSQVFGWLLLLLFPLIWQCITFAGNVSFPILVTCPNQVSLLCRILVTAACSCSSCRRVASFLIMSLLEILNILLNRFIADEYTGCFKKYPLKLFGIFSLRLSFLCKILQIYW